LIDLHTHTTASDGRLSAAELVTRARAAGVDVLSVTDHDTTSGCGPAAIACSAEGVEFVPGIEITAVINGGDVHVLGYFVDPDREALRAFLARQRRNRLVRVRQMIDRLAVSGIHLDAASILQPAFDDPTKAVGRPWIARALVAGGHVTTTDEAFDRWLAHDRPGYVPRSGARPEEVIARIHEAGGVASLAHPGVAGRDDLIPALVAAGLDALEAYHTDHDPETTTRYLGMADRLGVVVSGGSDYHADDSHGGAGPGSVVLPPDRYEALKSRRRR